MNKASQVKPDSRLPSRFFNQSRSTLRLSPGQRQTKQQFLQKLSSGSYEMQNVRCLCGSSSEIVLALTDRFGLPVRTVICTDCGTLRTNPRLTPDSYTKFYNYEYRSLYSDSFSAGERFFRAQVSYGKSIMAFISDTLPINENSVVYEIGCGSGGILLPFQQQGAKTIGCDVGEDYLHYGRMRGLNLLHGDSSSLRNFGQANLIILNHVFEHFTEVFDELARVSDLLAENGMVYIAVPGIKWLHRSYQNDLLRYLQNAHTYHFSVTTLNYHLATAGFENVIATEQIQSVYIKKNSSISCIKPVAECGETLNYIRSVETKRNVLLPLRSIWSLPYNALRSIALETGAIKLYRGVRDNLNIVNRK